MSKAYRFTLTLSVELHAAYCAEAERQGSEPLALMRDVLSDYALAHDLLPAGQAEELALYRSLSRRAAEAAARLVAEEGFHEDITLRTIRACEADPAWMADYRAYIQGDPYGKGNPRKANINAELGYRIKIAARADLRLGPNGKRITRKASGHIISNYSLLKPR